MSKFGLIQPTLIQQIKKILDQYPDDSQILKELIQNAEDAGAKEVKFLIDHHSYKQENLYHAGLAKYQGPALYAYNDATFNEDDWKGLQLLCDSIKVKDPTKVGRFGLGFKSVFHITDLPSVISGDSLGIMDPHEMYFSDENGRRSGFHWDLKDSNLPTGRISDQFAPYKGIFDCTETALQQGRYEGTLFRFPFRNEPSKLSDTVYSAEKSIQGLCNSFKTDAHLVLLFLMNLERIEIYERTNQMIEPRKLFSVGITEQCQVAVREARQRFNSKLSQNSCDQLTETYRVDIETLDFMSGTNRLHSFVITHYISGSNLSTEMKELVNDESLSYMPRVGVALPLNPNKLPDTAREPQGHLFCFLPLPQEAKSLTGLPVHVNGFFALSQNRRHLKWPSADMKNTTDKSLRWNDGLLREVLPNAYSELIRFLISEMSSEIVYSAWPDHSKVDVKWSVMLKPLWSLLFQWHILYSEADGGVWCKLEEVIFDNFKESDKLRKTVIDLLNKTGKKIVTVPDHVRMAASSRGPVKEVTARLLCETLKTCRSCYVNLSSQKKLLLLKFLLGNANFGNLDGLQLLPLSNKTFIDFLETPSPSNVIYIDSRDHSRTLIPGMQEKFLDSDIDNDVTMQLKTAYQGHTQLRLFDEDAVQRHLREALPSEWIQSNGQVTWHPGKSGQPTWQWLEQLWSYIGVHFSHDTGLDGFVGLPLIPISTNDQKEVQLVQIQRPSTLVLQSYNGEEIDGPISAVLSAVGVTVLENLPEFVKGHSSLVPAFINPPNPKGVLNALIIGNPQYPFLDTDMRVLRGFLSCMLSLTQKEIDFLRKFKLFDTHPGSGSQSRPVALNEVSLAAPVDDFPPVPSHINLVDLRECTSRNLAHLLGIDPMRHVQLMNMMLKQALDCLYSGTEVDELVKYILDRFGLFCKQQGIEEIMKQLKCLAFVISGDNTRNKPEQLFDPEDEHLKSIFIDEPDKFPKDGSCYSKPDVLVHLRTMGLKTNEDLSASDILKSATMVNKIQDVKKATVKSEAILKHLEDAPSLLQKPLSSNDSLADQLSVIPWVPVFVRREMYPMHLPQKCNLSFARPIDVTSAEFLNLVGSIKILVEAPEYPQVAHYFGWSKDPSLNEVISHLRNVVQCYQADEQNTFINVIKAVYLYLASQDITKVVGELKGQQIHKWIWNGDGFSTLIEVITEVPWLNLHPYLCLLPKETKEFVELFSACGMKRNLDNNMLLDILCRIKERHEYQASSNEVKRDLQHSIDILNELSSQHGEPLTPSLREKLLVPINSENDDRLELVTVDECTYFDREWLKQDRDDGDITDEDDVNIKFIHRQIPMATAEALGIPTLMSRILDADELQMVESFGQSESLLDRLKGLLDGYSDGLSVPKELIQNADDAGATEIRFLYDERTNEDAMTQLLDEGMKECQGPALWSYNDAVFTDDDFQNIVKLNSATKEDDAGKIGRFGLGFNSVYNLTDVPSFVSRDSIVILDPHTTYLGKVIRDKSKPGIKLKLTKKILRRLSNQFMPYNGVFGCDLRSDGEEKVYDGTLFRFPLRTKTQALKSGIKQLHYEVEQVKGLLGMLLKDSESLLLFTQNVLSIRVYHLSNEKSEILQPIELFSISKSCVNIIHRLKSEVSLSTPVQKLSSEKQELVKQSNILRVSSNFKQLLKKTMNVAPGEVLMKSAMVLTTESTISKHGNKFLSSDTTGNSKHQTTWLVHSCMVNGSALEMSLDSKGLLPTAGVAAQLKSSTGDGHFIPKPMRNSPEEASYQSGHVFCFLPLPIRSGLPVHINGCFAVDDSRRHLREKIEHDKFDHGAQWNRVLMSEVVSQAYVGLLEDLKNTCSSDFAYHLLWPQADEVLQQHCHGLASEFYRKLCSGTQPTSLKLFSNGVQWSAVDSVVFLEPSFKNDTRIKEAAQNALEYFVKTRAIAIDMPDEILHSFERYGVGTKIRERCFDKESFFKRVVFPILDYLEAPERDSLVLYAIDDDSPVLNALVRDNPCIPASPSEHPLKYPKDLIHPKRKTARLYDSEDGMFPYGDPFSTEERLLKLSKLGMRDNLEWEEVIERARSVTKLQSYDYSVTRTKLLLKFIDDKLKQTQYVDPSIQAQLQRVPFLPILKKPKTFPFEWKGDEYEETAFLAAVHLYHKSSKYLVSASAPILNDGKDGCSLDQSSRVQTFLGIIKEVSLDQAKLQLQTVIMTKVPSDRSKALKKACKKLYEYFQQCARQMENGVKTFLAPLSFVFIDNQFLNASQIAFENRLIFLPYISNVPSVYRRKFSELLRLVGVRKSFEVLDYIIVLREVKNKHGDNPIDGELLGKVKEVLQLLVDAIRKAGISSRKAMENYGTIYLPDSNGIMRTSGVLCIKDCHWMPDEDGIKYANDGISPRVCLTLGVSSRRQVTLSKFAEGIPFGQKEKLTNRLKRILTGYPCDRSIMKELLQNADDAKASKICFINDPRHHPDERVFEESWKPLQGPALCVYNNAPFTKSDIEGIQNLGEGSKGDDPNKTGQYGVGFNAVYHLTDVPSFISKGKEIGEIMCVFDPNLKYAPCATPDSPGVMYTDLDYIRKMFTDVFPCYLEQFGDHFPIENGTMFRFPLRNKEMAENSKISNKTVTTEKLNDLMMDFQDDLLEALLFVNNVKEISTCEISSGNVKHIYHVKASMSQKDEEKRQEFASYVNFIGNKLRSKEISIFEIPMKKVSYVLHLEDSKGRCQDWLVVQHIGFECTEDVCQEVDVGIAFERGDLGLLPRGGVASLISYHDKPPGKAFCFLPLPFQTGLPIHINGHFALDHEARRTLWRSETGDYRSKWNDILLRQVVAPCYVVMLDELRQFISLAATADNKTCLNKSLCDVKVLLSNYERYFPLKLSEPYWKVLATEVYRHMSERESHLLPVLREEKTKERNRKQRRKQPSQSRVFIEWLSPTDKHNKAFFDMLKETLTPDSPQNLEHKLKDGCHKSRLDAANVCRHTLLALGFNLLHLSMKIYHSFRESGIDVKCISPKEVLCFFHSYGSASCLSNQIGSLPLTIQNTPFQSAENLLVVLKYCKKEESFFQNLNGLPLLLTEDNQLRVFDETEPVFLSGFYDLLPTCHHMFVHNTIFNSAFYEQTKNDRMSPVFKVFDIREFARLLPGVLDESCRCADKYLSWNPSAVDAKLPSIRWIRRVWKFFYHVVEAVLKAYGYTNIGVFEERLMMAEKKQLILETLNPVMTWCLLPAIEVAPSHHMHLPRLPKEDQHLLVPLSMAQTVLSMGYSIYLENLRDAIQNMCLPQLNCKILMGIGCNTTSSTVITQRIVSNLSDPRSFLAVIFHKMKSVPSLFQDTVNRHHCVQVLRYFNDHIQYLQPGDAQNLKLLPLYPTVHGEHISISGKQAFVLPSRIPKDAMNIWEKEEDGIVFLAHNVNLEKLYSFLGCDSKDEVDVYCDIIFERFRQMGKEARLAHIEFVRHMLNELDTPLLTSSTCGKKDKLLQALYRLEFDLGRDGSLRRASSLYDPSNTVFKVVFANRQEMFPAKPFCRNKWLPFLRKIRLIHEVTGHLFLQFACEVEEEGKTNRIDQNTKSKSETLVSYLFKMKNVATIPLLDSVKDICFIFPKEVDHHLKQIHQPFGRQPCVCFKGSLALPHHFTSDIAWTTVSILPDYANPQYIKENALHDPMKEIMSRLGILESPTVGMVVNHCKNICHALCQRNDDPTKRLDINQNRNFTQNSYVKRELQIMECIYKFLQENYQNNKGIIKDGLQNERCIVVEDGTRFVYPRQVVVELISDDEIRPYLFKVPNQLAIYIELFQYLGSTKTVTSAQYAMVLDNIHMECGDAKLNPNETTNAFRATKGLFESIDKNEVKTLEIPTLYLPGVQRNPDDFSLNLVFLQKSTEMFYNDAPRFKERLKRFEKLLLVKLKECELKVDNDDHLITQLPESIRPRKLTSIVHETLPEGGQFSRKDAEELTRTLTSTAFFSGLIRLIKHAAYHRGLQIKDDIHQMLRKRLSCIRVYSVTGLRTRLVCEGTEIPESEAKVSCFEKKTGEENQEVWNIYVEEKVELSKYVSRIAEIVDRITGNQLGDALVHLPMMFFTTLEKLQSYLDDLKIREDNSCLEAEATCFPTPGSFIHVKDQHLLVDAFTVFSPGEYVGYELDDPSLHGKDGTPTYIYAIIIEEVSPEETTPSTKKYRINIGEEEPIVVDAVNLYKFHRDKPTGAEGLEIEVFTGPSTSDKQDTVKPDNLDEAKQQVRQTLEEAWNLPEETRKRIIKRLFLTWHPDKNPGNEEFCTEVFKFIQAEIKRLEKGSQPQSAGNFWNHENYDDLFSRWSSRARSHGTQRSNYFSHARSHGSQRDFYGGDFSSSSRPNPQPGEAARWYRQAEADLDVVGNDVNACQTSYEWACFKCHQSAEKALKAAQYSQDANRKSNTHYLPGIAANLGNDDLTSLARSLEHLLGTSARMRYPDHYRYPSIPHDNYTASMATQALEYARNILKEVKAMFVY